MHRDALAAGDIAADRVTRHRLAALRDLGEHAALAFDANFAGRLELGDERNERELAVAVRLRLTGRHVLEEHRVGADVAVSDGGVEIVQVGEAKLPGELEHPLLADRGERPLLHPPELLVEQLLALGDVLLAPLLLEPDANLLRGSRRLDEAQPVAARSMRSLRGEDLEDVTVLELVVERHHAAVGLGADAAMPNLGVDPVGKIDGRRARRQGQHVPFRGEDEHLVAKDVDLDGVYELLGVEHFLLPVHQLAQPGEALVHLAVVLAALFVGPVGRHAPLRRPVHLLGANLDLHRLAAVADHGGVQRLVPVRLRHRDVVLETAGNRLPERVDDTQGAVAILDGIGQHADRGEIVDILELLPHGELARDAVDVLGPPRGIGLDADAGQLAFQDLLDVVDGGLPLLPLACDLLDDLAVLVGMQLGEGEVFQLPLDVPHAQAVRQRGINVQGLLRHRPPPDLGQGLDRPHVVEPVGQLHEHHPDVLRHRHEHLANVLRLRLFGTVEGDLLQLGDAGDQLANRRPEALLQVGNGQVGVFHGVVEDGGRQGVAIQLEVRQDGGDAQRVLDELLARQPILVVVSTGGSIVGPRQDLDVLRRQVAHPGQ